jgi:intracellular sulfur oxidation DsrE/DsrF family protein
MANYLLIASRDPFEHRSVDGFYELAGALVHAGHKVTLFLVQNGVLPARGAVRPDRLAGMVQSGVEVLADDFSLRERAIPAGSLAGGVKAAAIEAVIDRLAQGYKALWH